MAEDKNNEEEKFDFTSEGEGYISLDEARVLAIRTAVASPGDYGRDFRGTLMVFNVVESTETDDHYMVTLSVRPQGNFDGTPGQEQFVVGKDGTIAVRQVLGLPIQTSAQLAGTASKGGGFPVLPAAIGLVIVGAIAAVGAAFVLMSSGGDNVPIAAVSPTETPAAVVIPADTPEPTANIAATVEAGIQKGLGKRPTSVPVPTATYRGSYFGYFRTPIPSPTRPRPIATPNASSYFHKGDEYLNSEKWAMAIAEYTKAIQLDPDYAWAYLHRGVAYHNRIPKQNQNAINDYTMAIQVGGSNDSLAYNNRGIAYQNLGQTAQATADQARACSLNSQYCPPPTPTPRPTATPRPTSTPNAWSYYWEF